MTPFSAPACRLGEYRVARFQQGDGATLALCRGAGDADWPLTLGD